MDCKNCKSRYRADKIIEDFDPSVNGGSMSDEQLTAYIKEHKLVCPKCGSANFSEIRQFNMMFKTFQGVLEEEANQIYLRPETAQGIFC